MEKYLIQTSNKKNSFLIRRFNAKIAVLNKYYSKIDEDKIFKEYRFFSAKYTTRNALFFIFLILAVLSYATTYYYSSLDKLIFYFLIGLDVFLSIVFISLYYLKNRIKHKTKFLYNLSSTIDEIENMNSISKLYKIDYIYSLDSIKFNYAKRHKFLSTFKNGYISGVFAIHCLDNYFRIDKVVPIIISSCINYGYHIHALAKYIAIEYKKYISKRRYDSDYSKMFSYLNSHNLSLKNIRFTMIEKNYWDSKIEEEYMWVKNLNLFDISWMEYK